MADAEWHKMADIVFSRPQMQWLISNLETLKEGIWPPNPRGTGYTDVKGGGYHSSASFTRPCEFAAECESRLEATGKDGRWLKKEIEDESSWYGLTREAKSALNYISGWRRKHEDYEQWKKDSGMRRLVNLIGQLYA